MKVTIIGGSGFVGTRLAERLIKQGYDVRIADKRKSLAFPALWMRCDIRNAPAEKGEYGESLSDAASAAGAEEEARREQPMHSLLECLEGSDTVINLAAEHRDDVTPRSLYDDVNVKGSENVCAACTALGIRRLIFTSSVAVYGSASAGTDESGAIGYFNDYGRTKALAEEKCREWLKSFPLNSCVIIRPCVVFGERNRGNVYNLLRQIASGRFPMVGKGENRKSMSYVENVAAFIEFCLARQDALPCVEEGFDGAVAGRLSLFNYCDEPVYDMNSLVLDVYRHLGKRKTHLVHFPYWLAYLGGLCFDLIAAVTRRKLAISSIRVKKFCQETYFTSSRVAQTGFATPVPLEEGLRRTIDYEFVRKVQGHTFLSE